MHSTHHPASSSSSTRPLDGQQSGFYIYPHNSISAVTPQDGLSLGLFLDTLTLGKVLGGPGEFDPQKLVWIGRMNATATVMIHPTETAAQKGDAMSIRPGSGLYLVSWLLGLGVLLQS